MAKFRTTHARQNGRGSGSMITKVGIFSLIVGAFYFAFQQFSGNGVQPDEPVVEDVTDLENTGTDSIFYLPASSNGQVIRHKYFALSYNEDFELAEWVAFELTATRLSSPWVDRTNDFRPDTKVATGSATPNDYRNTHFDRGHLAAAADMAFSTEAMSESFYMSNMAPQDPGFNKGVWRELEELNRDWAKRFKHLYVITGPVLTQPIKFWIGENQVAVPPAFYRVILDIREPEKKAIAFVVPNEVTDKRISEFATSIDAVEALTGIDFFAELLEENLEEALESAYDMDLWETDEKKYQVRVKEWNLRR